MKALLAAVLATGIGIGVAPSAAADESEYINQLQPRMAFLTADQLRSEGYRVCRYLSVGRPSADAIAVVMKDLHVTVAVALDIVAASIQELEC